MLDIGIVHMIGYADGRVAQNLSPANQLAGYELAVTEGGVSVQIDHISPAETLLCIKHYLSLNFSCLVAMFFIFHFQRARDSF